MQDFGSSWTNLTEQSAGRITSFRDFDWGAKMAMWVQPPQQLAWPGCLHRGCMRPLGAQLRGNQPQAGGSEVQGTLLARGGVADGMSWALLGT